MASRTNNFNNDLAMPWWNGVTRQRVFRDIASETEKGNTGLATKRQLKEESQNLVSMLTSMDIEEENSFGSLEHEMQITYAAAFGLVPDPNGSGFVDGQGNYYETLYAKIQADAESISEQFQRQQEYTQETFAGMDSAIHTLTETVNGEIRRGFINVTEGGQTVTYFGIAITSHDIFAAEATYTDDEGNSYYEVIDEGACFGLYTAEGWQFWRGNQRMGWYNTSDHMLHVEAVSVDGGLRLGPWEFVHELVNGNYNFGLKFTGDQQ